MKIPNTNITLEEVLDQMPMNLQFVDKDGFLRYLNKAAAIRPARVKGRLVLILRTAMLYQKAMRRLVASSMTSETGRKNRTTISIKKATNC